MTLQDAREEIMIECHGISTERLTDLLSCYAKAYARSVVPEEDKDMPERWLSTPKDFAALAWNACREEMLENIEK